jgi:hypothetical protein
LTSARAHHVNAINVEDIYNIEGLGVACSPCCGGCKCGKCPKGSNDYTLKEKRELKLIKSKLTFDDEEKKWTAEYQWIRNDLLAPSVRILVSLKRPTNGFKIGNCRDKSISSMSNPKRMKTKSPWFIPRSSARNIASRESS